MVLSLPLYETVRLLFELPSATGTDIEICASVSRATGRRKVDKEPLDTMKSTRRVRSYIVEAAVGVALVYFVLGGSGWSPLGWAAFCVLAVSPS